MIYYPLKLSMYNIMSIYAKNFYIYNTLHDVLMRLTSKDYKYLNAIGSSQIAQKEFSESTLLRLMYKNGLLVNIDYDESDMLLQRINAHKYGGDTLINAITVLGCNMDCSYCFEKWYGSDELTKNEYLSDAFFEKYIKYLHIAFNERNYSKLKIAWFGGEPMLAWNKIKEFTPRIKSMCESNGVLYRSSLITNGTLINKIMPDDYGLLDYIQVTLDGTQDTHDKFRRYKNGKGTYSDIIESILNIPNEVPLVVRINVSSSNLEPYKELLELLAYRHITTTIDFSPIFIYDNPTAGETVKRDLVGLRLDEYIDVESALIDFALECNFMISGTLFPSPLNSTCWRILPNAFHISADSKIYGCVANLGETNNYYGYIDDSGHVIKTNMKRWLEDKYISITISNKCRICQYSPLCALSCVHSHDCTPYKNPELVIKRAVLKANILGKSRVNDFVGF